MSDDDNFNVYEDRVREAWCRWEWESCIERHGDHLWVMELLGPEDGNYVDIDCEYCHIPANAAYEDIYDLLYGEVVDPKFGIEIEVDQGRHGMDEHYLHYEIPVKLKVEVKQYFNPLDMIYPEYDVYLILSSRS